MFVLPLMGAKADTLTFHNGIDLWLSSSNTPDSGNPNLGWGRNVGANSRSYDTLITFTNMFGTELDQIPIGSTITSATLNLFMDEPAYTRTSWIYQMTVDWNSGSTWNSIGGGIIPGANTKSTPEYTWTSTNQPWGWELFDLTNSVQDWSNGADQYGWGFTATRSYVFTACSMNYSSPSYRPFLEVDFTAPAPVPEPATMLLLCSGLGLAGLIKLKKLKLF